MKIAYQDKNKLVLRPGGLVFILMGVFSLVAGLLGFFFMGQEQRLHCQHTPNQQIQCQMTTDFFGLVLKEEPIDALRSARVDMHLSKVTSRSSSGMRRTRSVEMYQVVLVTAHGERNLGTSSSNATQRQRFAEAINTFVQSPNLPELDIAFSEKGFLWFNGIFVLIGLAVIVGGIEATFTTWTFDRKQNIISHRRETLLGVKVKDYPLNEIINVKIGKSHNNSRGRQNYRIELWTQNEDCIPLTLAYTSGYPDKERAAQAIREFLA